MGASDYVRVICTQDEFLLSYQTTQNVQFTQNALVQSTAEVSEMYILINSGINLKKEKKLETCQNIGTPKLYSYGTDLVFCKLLSVHDL